MGAAQLERAWGDGIHQYAIYVGNGDRETGEAGALGHSDIASCDRHFVFAASSGTDGYFAGCLSR